MEVFRVHNNIDHIAPEYRIRGYRFHYSWMNMLLIVIGVSIALFLTVNLILGVVCLTIGVAGILRLYFLVQQWDVTESPMVAVKGAAKTAAVNTWENYTVTDTTSAWKN